MISEQHRLQYLEALGIQPWMRKDRVVVEAPAAPADPAESAARLADTVVREAMDKALSMQASHTATQLGEQKFVIGPGTGQTLMLCNSRQDSAMQLANDIARCLVDVPVWGWVAPVDSSESLELRSAVKERLFTRILVFSGAKTRGGEPTAIGSAQFIRAPLLSELANNPDLKRVLWTRLCTEGWCA